MRPWIRKALGRLVNLSDLSPYQPVDFLKGGPAFNPINAIQRIPTAAASIRFLTSTLARVDKRVVSRERFPEDRPGHWLNVLLENPQPGVNRTTFWRGVGFELWTRGRALLVLERSPIRSERVIGLTPARLTGSYAGSYNDPNAVFDVNVMDGVGYALRSRRVRARDLIILTDDQRDALTGRIMHPLSPISGKAYLTLKLWAAIIDRYIATQPLGANAELALLMSADAIKSYVERYTEKGGALSDPGIPLFLETGTDVKQIGAPNRDGQSLDMAKFLIGEMSRIWGVPLFILQSDQQSGKGGTVLRDTGEQFLHFVSGDFGTTCRAIADEINLKVLGPNRQVEVTFDVETLSMGSVEKRAQVINSLVQRSGIVTPNWARERFLGLGPVDGGDELRVPTGGTPGQNGEGGADNEPDPAEPDDAPSEEDV